MKEWRHITPSARREEGKNNTSNFFHPSLCLSSSSRPSREAGLAHKEPVIGHCKNSTIVFSNCRQVTRTNMWNMKYHVIFPNNLAMEAKIYTVLQFYPCFIYDWNFIYFIVLNSKAKITTKLKTSTKRETAHEKSLAPRVNGLKFLPFPPHPFKNCHAITYRLRRHERLIRINHAIFSHSSLAKFGNIYLGATTHSLCFQSFCPLTKYDA